MEFPVEVLVLFLTLGLFSGISYKKNLLNLEGILIANIVGLAIFILGTWNLSYLFVAILFFIAAEAGTWFLNKKKGKHEIRTTGNILGNSGTAVIFLALGFHFGFFAAFSSALADTLSSEIGILSKKKPVLITSLEEVPHGTDGGITMLGMLASVLGAGIIAVFHFLLFQNILLFFILIISGVFGSVSDSFFGAVFERKGKLNNAEVNFLGSFCGTCLAILLASFLG